MARDVSLAYGKLPRVKICITALAAAAAIMLSGCGSSPAGPSAASASPLPSATPLPVTQVISAAETQECGSLDSAYLRIQDDTSGDKVVAELIPTVAQNAKAWMYQLKAAASVPASIPDGRNRAGNMAGRISRANFNVGMLNLYAAQGITEGGKIGPQWRKISRELNSINSTCANGQ